MPKESGQSGTASPDPVDVTSPPATIRNSVAAAVRQAKRFNRERGAVMESETMWGARNKEGGAKDRLLPDCHHPPEPSAGSTAAPMHALLEGEIGAGRGLRRNGYGLALRVETLVPYRDLVVARRQSADRVRAVVPRHRIKRMVQHA